MLHFFISLIFDDVSVAAFQIHFIAQICFSFFALIVDDSDCKLIVSYVPFFIEFLGFPIIRPQIFGLKSSVSLFLQIFIDFIRHPNDPEWISRPIRVELESLGERYFGKIP